MLRDMITHALAGQPGVEIISEPPPPPPDPSLALTPDVVILGTQDPDANGSAAVFRRWPHSRVLMISTSGDRGFMVELQPRRIQLPEVSLTELIAVVTQVGRQARRPSRDSPAGP